jgi:alginate O-acetyltransferase complex protein AlgI
VNPTTTEVLSSPIADRAARPAAWPAISRHTLVVVQLLLAVLVVHIYAIEGAAFERVFGLAAAGFVVNLALPMQMRLPFFVALSGAGAVLVFGAGDAAWLFAAGLVLIGLCHLPFSFRMRAIAIAVAGAVLAVSRAGLVPAPWSGAVWPILGSMFMFRIVLYMLGMKAAKGERGPWWWPLAYFFMLPNLVFPLFPVVDYQTFRRTYYDRNEEGIHEQGMLWIARGLVHLLLYRFVYHGVLNDPIDVVRFGDLVQFMLGTFLLYLRVSGQFHLIVGILHLFGFRLPETHKLYYLAHSFTELWRRINIYWTDFMMKAVFYPTYFRVKKLGPTRALVVSTVAVFFTTWILHSYQWFWLRGGFPLTLQDTLFWGILGALVVTGAVKESKAVKKPRTKAGAWSWRLGVRAAATFFAFCFLWSLWSTESVSEWLWMLGAASNVDAKGVVLIALAFGVVFALGGRDWEAAGRAESRSPAMALAVHPLTRSMAALILLLAASQPSLVAVSPKVVADGLRSLHTTGLNARDAALQHRGYYEQLDVRAQATTAAQAVDASGPQRADWRDLSTTGVLRERRDWLIRDLLPSRSVLWNGKTFSTNQWGMRDKEYARDKPAGALRIALLGPSHVMGNGVADGETFEALVEDRLNAHLPKGNYGRIEILNFGVDGYSLPQQVAILEDRVLGFAPDVVIATHYHRNRYMTERYLVKLVAGGIQPPHQALNDLLGSAGFSAANRGGVPVPFAAGRRIASWLGVDARMPNGEAEARARWIADDTLNWAFDQFARDSRARGMTPVVLGLNAVIDDAPDGVPHLAAMQRANLPVIDLFDVFPPGERASLRVAPWDDHPNAAGHKLIADRLYAALRALLDEGTLGRAASTAGNQANGRF